MTHKDNIQFTHDGLIQAVLIHGILLDPSGQCQEVHGEAERFMRTQEWQGKPIEQVLHPDLAEEYQDLCASLDHMGTASVHGDHMTLIPLFDTGWMVLRVKASQHERREDRIPRRTDQDPFTRKTVPEVVGLVYLTPDLQVRYTNQAFVDLTGFEDTLRLPEPLHSAVAHHLQQPPRESGTLLAQECVFQDGSGTLQQGRFTLREVKGTQGNQAGYILQLERLQREHLHQGTPMEQHLQKERWQHALENIGAGVWDWDVVTGQVYLSSSWFRILEQERTDCTVSLQEWLQDFHAEDQEQLQQALLGCQGPESLSCQLEVRARTATGQWIPVLVRGKAVATTPEGQTARMVGSLSDISELRRTEQELERLSERIQLASRTVGIGVWEWNIEQNRMLWDQHMLDIYGLTQAQFEENTLSAWDQRLHPEDAARVLQEVDWALGDVRPFETEYRIIWPDGQQRVIRSSASVVRNGQGQPVRFLGVDWDITSHKQAEELIHHQAHHDSLTGLPNRKLFMELLTDRLKSQGRNSRICAVLFINLDRFKDVNDSLGHDAGDLLLKEVATRLKLCVRESDLVARVGGDEFTVLLSSLDEGVHAGNIADRILQVLSHPYQLHQKPFLASASIGISVYPNDAMDPEDLLNCADQAMTVAKGEGKNCWRFFTPSMLQATRERRTVIADFTLALKRQEFEVYYQPILSYACPHLLKAEALLRWKHPQKGMISPGVFIPLAEEVGLIHALGDWCLRQVLQDQQKWRAEGLPCPVIAINTSAKQFTHDDVARKWLHALQEFGASSDQLIMEITESLLLQKQQEVVGQLQVLRDAGVRIALDDFGTGYSSLSYLSSFELDYLKIDRSFVQGIVHNSKDEAVTDAIIAMAHKLGLEVVAEGVETPDQEEVLRRQHCDFAQGYFYARPMPEAQFREFVVRQQLLHQQ